MTTAQNTRRILILFAHPSQQRSEVNRPLSRTVRDLPGVTFVDLYHEYPTLEIDVRREQERLRQHDVVLFMFPFYWYSTPAILKEWQDLVLEYGFAYGHHGRELEGKLFLAVVSAGGDASAYSKSGYNHFPVRELMRPLEMTANLCHMRYLPPFFLFAARKAADEGRLKTHIESVTKLIDQLHREPLDLDQLEALPLLNQAFEPEASHD
ncbi:NAD(P)H-dependent oxidoreductase [Ferrimonas marina]|nr:NAD(P)H-dependent oxidoreductase [Ferrimonas marina]